MKNANFSKFLSFLFFVALGTISVGLLGQEDSDFVPNEILISFVDGDVFNIASASENTFYQGQIEGTDTEIWSVGDVVTYGGDTIIGTENIAEYFESFVGVVKYAEPNYILKANGTPNDPYYNDLWGMEKIQASKAWDISEGDDEMAIAILDTGIDFNHPDLINNIWQNPGEDADGDGSVLEWTGTQWVFDPGDVNGIDDDGNGYADDFVGWDFVNNDNTVEDYNCNHGTHVAGTIGATGNNEIGVIGVSPNVKFMAVKVLDYNYESNWCMGATSEITKGLNYAVAMGAKISNNSYGGYNNYSETFKEAIHKAEENNHLFIASAGNDGLDNDTYKPFPASYDLPNIISVASTMQTDELSNDYFVSNFGNNTVDLAAPGSYILSTISNGAYAYGNGTSMAAPHVAGVAALIAASCGVSDYQSIKNKVMESTDKLPNLSGKCVSGGRLNAYNALTGCESTPCLESDSLTLIAFINALGGDAWNNTWDISKPISEWYGVNLSDDKCSVKEINLPNNNLVGSIPAILSELSNLTTLNLNGNQLTGAIPNIFLDMPELEFLLLNDNFLTGCYPYLCNISNTNFDNNAGLPNGGENETYQAFCIDNNSQYGLPCDDGNAATSNDIIQTDCKCRGEVNPSTCLEADYQGLIALYNATNGDGWTNKWDITQPVNTWSGVILSEDGCKVVEINLSNNNLDGTLPYELSYLTDLTKLYLANNNLRGCYPESLCDLNLTDFDFTENPGLPSGGANDGFTNFCTNFQCINECIVPDSLVLIDLYNSTNGDGWINKWDITQPVNTWFGVTLSEDGCRVVCLDLDGVADCALSNTSGNNLEGTLPKSIGQLSSLQRLYLCNNSIEGVLPDELGDLTSLTHLYLRFNKISGFIPASLSKSNSLIDLRLRSNFFTGSIPSEFGQLVNLKYLILSYNDLSGEIPVELGQLVNLQGLYLNSNNLEGCYDESLCNIDFQMAYFADNPNLPDGGSDEGFANFCNGTQSCLIGECEIPVLDLGPDRNIECGQSFVLSTNLTDMDYTLWEYNSEVFAVNVESIEVSIPGTYIVVVTDTCGNVAIDSIEIGETVNCVWPGDMNYDGIVNYLDFLSFGPDYNKEGPTRDNGSCDWIGQGGEDWAHTDSTGVNDKHSDANGDGIVSRADLEVIVKNYNQVHSDEIQLNATPMYGYFVPEQSEYSGFGTFSEENEKVIMIDLIILQNIIDAKGVGCKVDFKDINAKEVYFIPNEDLFGKDTINSENYYSYDEERKSLEIAVTRTDGGSIKSGGLIGYAAVVVDENLGSFGDDDERYQFIIRDAVLVNSEGELFALKKGELQTFSNSVEIGKDVIKLNAGWNLISLDVTPANRTFENIFSSLDDGNLEQVVWYDNGAFVYSPNMENDMNTMYEVKEGLGYWVKVKEEDELIVHGVVPEEIYNKTLNAGWNLTAFQPKYSYSPEIYFDDLIEEENLLFITGYDDGEELIFNPLNGPENNTLNVLENGDGVWINVINPIGEGTADVNNSTHVFEFVNGTSDLSEGNEVLILNATGEVVDTLDVLADGRLMTTAIYGDDPLTYAVTEGLLKGESLSFVWEEKTIENYIQFEGEKNIRNLDLKFLTSTDIVGISNNILINTFPNPVVNEIFIEVNLVNPSENLLVEIFDVNGKVMMTFEEKLGASLQAQFNYDITDLSAGRYMYRVSNESGSYSDSFIKL